MTLPEQEFFIKQRERLMLEMERVMSGKSKQFVTVTEFALHSGFSRRTLYRIRKRWLKRARSKAGLLHRRRGPKGLPYGKPPKSYERIIVKMHRRLGWSAPLIAAYLKAHNIANSSTGQPQTNGKAEASWTTVSPSEKIWMRYAWIREFVVRPFCQDTFGVKEV